MKLIADEDCLLCLGTGWQRHDPKVLGTNLDGTDLLSEPAWSICRCATEVDEDDEDEDDYFNPDDDDNIMGGALVLA